MKAFVTGGTGFVGGRVVQKLVERGYQVSALARTPKDIVDFQTRGITPVPGDITNMESMRNAMRGSDVVFHIVGWYRLGLHEGRPDLRVRPAHDAQGGAGKLHPPPHG